MDPLSFFQMAMAILKSFLALPIVSKAIDNFVDGTSNEIDDMVWDAIKRVLSMRLVPDLAKEKLAEELEDIQAYYDRLDPDEKWAAKKPKFVWKSDDAGRFTFST